MSTSLNKTESQDGQISHNNRLVLQNQTKVHLLQVRHGRVEVVEHFRERDGVGRGYVVVFGEIDHARPEGHLDLDERFVTVGQQILGFTRVYPDHTQQKMTGRPEGHFHLKQRKGSSTTRYGRQAGQSLTFGCSIPSTDVSMLVSNTWALVSFLSQWAANQIRASGPFLDSEKCE